MTDQRVILAIDDDIDICELISATAEANGLRCIATSDVDTFLRSIDADTSLILLDLMMPGIDGIQLLRQLGNLHCTAAIVLMSGVGKRIIESARELALAHGLTTVSHLQKPFRVIELEEFFARQVPTATTSAPTPRPQIKITDKDLRTAIKRREFIAYYQPQIDIVRGHMVGMEALARWQHPRLGLVYPDTFVPVAEREGLMRLLTLGVLEIALAQQHEWKEAGLTVPMACRLHRTQGNGRQHPRQHGQH